LQAGGRRFEPCHVHQIFIDVLKLCFASRTQESTQNWSSVLRATRLFHLRGESLLYLFHRCLRYGINIFRVKLVGHCHICMSMALAALRNHRALGSEPDPAARRAWVERLRTIRQQFSYGPPGLTARKADDKIAGPEFPSKTPSAMNFLGIMSPNGQRTSPITSEVPVGFRRKTANVLKRMVGPCGLKPQTSTVSEGRDCVRPKHKQREGCATQKFKPMLKDAPCCPKSQ